jgi:ATPase subunit of ABC transporter with duplicated ATPase domains
MSLSIPSTGLPPSRRVLEMDSFTFGYAPDRPLFEDVSVSVIGPERIAIKGANACGKSTLLALISGRSSPQTGTVRVHVPLAFVDQRVSLLDPEQTIAENFRRLNPGTDNNSCRAALARFLFRANAADQRVGTLSGGQLLRAGLACVLAAPSPPSLLLLDEPTNHLDLDSIAAVEATLSAYNGALIVVSHDDAFLDAIGTDREISIGRGKLSETS